jgi:hypothetical protein
MKLTLFSLLILSLGALGACSDDVGTGPGGELSVDPGRCLTAPEFEQLKVGDGSLAVSGVAVSCTHVAWLAPIETESGLSEAQVQVHDITGGFSYRTTAPAEVDEEPATRWSPALHGFWLAYAEENRVVVENLRDYERAEFEAKPSVGKVVDVHYPWVVWQQDGDFGRTVVYAGHLEDGMTVQVTPSDATATHISVDSGRVVYTLWPEDLDGPLPTLDGSAQVQVFNLGVDEVGMAVHPTDAMTMAGSVYGDTVAYLLKEEGETYVVARSLTSGVEIGAVTGGIPDDAWPQSGASVITWFKYASPTQTYVAWWPHLGHIDELPFGSNASMFDVGEHLLVSDAGDDAALNVELLYPRETSEAPEGSE